MNDNAGGSFIELTADIVSAYVSNNSVSAGEIPSLISQVHSALMRVSAGQSDVQPEPLKPAVSLKKSITPDYLICLEDGKKFKSLKRHLRTQYNMTPEQYREKWGLPPDYPMVAPNYAQARSQLAKQMGLGQQRRRRSKEFGSLCCLNEPPRARVAAFVCSGAWRDFFQSACRSAGGWFVVL